MTFDEAMGVLKKGIKVTREGWKNSYHLSLEDDHVISYAPCVKYYIYDEDILISNGWLLGNDKKEYNFSQIIPHLRNGVRAKLKDWNDSYIYYSSQERDVMLYTIEQTKFIPNFKDFLADDWITLHE